MTETPKTLQELLLSIATGDLEEFRVHKRKDVVTGEPAEVLRQPGRHPGLWDELQTTIARLSRVGSSAGTGARPAETAVPYHRRASEVAHRLGNTVSTWARLVAEENPKLDLTAKTVPEAARWLAHWLGVFPSLRVEHREMALDILGAVSAAKRVIDRAPDRVYAGPCREPLDIVDQERLDAEVCPGHLYARKTPEGKPEPFVTCRDCRTKHDVAVRKEWMSRTLRGQVVTAAEAAPVLSWITDKEIKVQTIFNWRSKGRITAVPSGADSGPDRRVWFRFNELEALATEVKTRDTKPRAKRASKEGSAA